MSDTCAHGRGRTVRCRQCEREGLVYGRSPLTDAREALEGEPMLRLTAPGHEGDPEVRAWLDDVARRIEREAGPVLLAALMDDLPPVPASLQGETVEVVADGRAGAVAPRPPRCTEPCRTCDQVGGRAVTGPRPAWETYGRGALPVSPDGAISSLTERVVRERMAAIEAMLARSRETAAAHCRATGDSRAAFPVLATDGRNPVEGVERLEVRCGVCETPVDGLLFSVRLQIGREAAVQA